MVTGWWDLFLPAQLTDFAALQAAGVPARITVGPWLHGEPGELRAIMRSDVEWLDHHLRGGPAPAGAAGAGLPAAGRHLAGVRRVAAGAGRGRSCCTCAPAAG